MWQIVRDDFYHETGEWRRLHQVFDRAKDWYSKIVTDPETGKILYKFEERLSEHRGHGSAKYCSPKKDDRRQ
jgi:hypothetical protein